MRFRLLLTILALSSLQFGCGKEALFESFTFLEESHDRSIVEPVQREYKSYYDYQKKREQLIRENKKDEEE